MYITILLLFCGGGIDALSYQWPTAMYQLGAGRIVPNKLIQRDDAKACVHYIDPELPSGMYIDKATGTIQGTLSDDAEPSSAWYTTTIVCSNGSGGDAEKVHVYIVIDTRVPYSWKGMPPHTKG